eukprot:CAMPEP_0168510130 /NCGR_PEP_ID=MMETSP0405-20121227/1245_1 /TAXON_ID=498012 /ORGANISM="Trichosphaerium sp, Strain Am-I-7 wt" /LENGTH=251 /DNA_ID=CAMNT_0008527835 /DNA_START=36 /DNA_END=791 /DNA_ORIENTATION=-
MADLDAIAKSLRSGAPGSEAIKHTFSSSESPASSSKTAVKESRSTSTLPQFRQVSSAPRSTGPIRFPASNATGYNAMAPKVPPKRPPKVRVFGRASVQQKRGGKQPRFIGKQRTNSSVPKRPLKGFNYKPPMPKQKSPGTPRPIDNSIALSQEKKTRSMSGSGTTISGSVTLGPTPKASSPKVGGSPRAASIKLSGSAGANPPKLSRSPRVAPSIVSSLPKAGPPKVGVSPKGVPKNNSVRYSASVNARGE